MGKFGRIHYKWMKMPDHRRVCFTFHAGDVFLLEELALYFAQKRVIQLIVIVIRCH